jgi:hypothetical protein
MSIPLFGKLVFDLGEAKSYEAAIRGDIPTIKLGGKKRVPVRVALRRVGFRRRASPASPEGPSSRHREFRDRHQPAVRVLQMARPGE